MAYWPNIPATSNVQNLNIHKNRNQEFSGQHTGVFLRDQPFLQLTDLLLNHTIKILSVLRQVLHMRNKFQKQLTEIEILDRQTRKNRKLEGVTIINSQC
jgi:hypothetical protein